MNEYYGSERPVMGRCEDSSQRKRDSGGAPVTAQELRNWLVSKVAGLTGVDPQEIGVGKPFTAFGVTSREAVALSGELEDLLGRRLSPTLLYDYPSIEAVVRRLEGQIKDPDPGRQSGLESTPVADPLDEILAQLEALSEDAAEAMLEKQALTPAPRGEEPR
ncbi:MAG TPA: acyl carrier protein [Blastocatellia bacterium]